MSKLLINESPLQVIPTLAVFVGLNESIALQQLHYLMQEARLSVARRYIENEGTPFEVVWIKNTFLGSFNKHREKIGDGWVDEFPFWSEPTIKRTFANLINDGLIRWSDAFNKYGKDRTRWYTINYEALDILSGPVPRIMRKNDKRTEAALLALEARKNGGHPSMDQVDTLNGTGSIDQNDTLNGNRSLDQVDTLNENGSMDQVDTMISMDQNDTMYTMDHLDTAKSAENGPYKRKRSNYRDVDGGIVKRSVDGIPDLRLCHRGVIEGDAIVTEAVTLAKTSDLVLGGDLDDTWQQIACTFNEKFRFTSRSSKSVSRESPLWGAKALSCEGDTLTVQVVSPQAALRLRQGAYAYGLAGIVSAIKPGLVLTFEQKL